MFFHGDNSNEEEFEKEYLSPDALIIENEQEKNVPKKMGLAEIASYPIFEENIVSTICLILVLYIFSRNIFGFFFAFLITIIFAIIHIAKILKLPDFGLSFPRFLLLFVYLFVLNIVALPADAKIYWNLWNFFTNGLLNSEEIPRSFVMNFRIFIAPLVAFINAMLAYGFIITFALREYRPFWTYRRYFWKMIRNNIILTGLFFCCYIFSFQLVSLVYKYDILVSLIATVNFVVTEYLLIIIMLSWTNFLHEDIYPELPPDSHYMI